jgi:hypothetical protein
MVGIWDISPSNPVYLRPQAANNRPYGRPIGICVSDVRFQGGKVNATVSFPKAENGGVGDVSGGILFGYRSLNDEYVYAAVGGYGFAYVMARFTTDRGWVAFHVAGTSENLKPEQPYVLSARMQGQRMTLEVDGVQVLAYTLETPPPQGQLGLFAWSLNKVEFKEVSVTEEPGKVFVVIPFKDYYIKDLFADVIKPIVEEKDNNLAAQHAGERLGPGIIIKDIEKDISESKIVIADLTEPNPNVYYEVGYAHALKIPTILLVQTDTKLPFDISGYRYIFYENSIGGRRKIVEQLPKHVQEILGR